jgi:predicted nucleic acid-binding Zn ribbon protein
MKLTIVKCLVCENFTTNPKFCSRSCSCTFNNKLRKANAACLFCNIEIRKNKKYCSNKCQVNLKIKNLIDDWINKIIFYKTSREFMKRHIMLEQNFCCKICNQSSYWNNKYLVLILDHIDGNSENNLKENLRCVCPNCDSQLPTYKSKNIGNGRFSRRKRYAMGQSF